MFNVSKLLNICIYAFYIVFMGNIYNGTSPMAKFVYIHIYYIIIINLYSNNCDK